MSPTLEDLLTTWGREFVAAIPAEAEASGQDACEVFHAAFDRDPDRAFLAALTEADFARLAAAANAELERDDIEASAMGEAVRRTLWHWSGS